MLIQEISQQQLSAAALYLHRKRQAPCEFDEAMIEQRLAGFETDRHAGAVDFDEDVVGQIRNLIEIHHPLDRIGQPGPARMGQQRQINLSSAEDE